MRLVNVDVGPFLISRQNDFVMNVEIARVVQDHFQVVCFLHVILASPALTTDVRNLLILAVGKVFLPLIEIVIIVVIYIWILVVLMVFGNLENDVMLFVQVLVVGVDQLELIVIGNVVILFHLSFDNHVELILFRHGHEIFLDQELRVLMFQEWGKISVSPKLVKLVLIIGGHAFEVVFCAWNMNLLHFLEFGDLLFWWIPKLVDVFNLNLIIAFIRSEFSVSSPDAWVYSSTIVFIINELVSGKGIDALEGDFSSFLFQACFFVDFDLNFVSNILDSLLEWLLLGSWTSESCDQTLFDFENYELFVSVF